MLQRLPLPAQLDRTITAGGSIAALVALPYLGVLIALLVIQPEETRTPMAAIFRSPTQTPVSPGLRPAARPKSAAARINTSSRSRR